MFSKISSRELLHGKRVSEMSKFDPNIRQNASNCTILKIFLGGMPPNPLAMRLASPRAACRFSDMQIFKSQKKYFLPPPPKSWLRP